MNSVNASSLRLQIETALADRIPSALTPAARVIRPVAPTGISAVDELLRGGLPFGAISEISGPECSGRTSLALSFIARVIAMAKVCAWIDVSNAFHPETAAAAGIALNSLLWIRCGATASSVASLQNYAPAKEDQHSLSAESLKAPVSSGFCGHPRSEMNGLSEAVSAFLKPQPARQHSRELDPHLSLPKKCQVPTRGRTSAQAEQKSSRAFRTPSPTKPWSRIEQALHAADLLLQAGGFGALVLDMAGIPADYASRVPLATWFRFRAAAERTQTSILLLTQHPCARSSASLLLSMQQSNIIDSPKTVFTSIEHRICIRRERFQPEFPASISSKVIPIRKPPQSEREAIWQSIPAWVGMR